MSSQKLSDSEAKDILRKWPQVTSKLFVTPSGDGNWLRAAPKSDKVDGKDRILPKIHSLGSSGLLTTHPDGLYVVFSYDKGDDGIAETPYADVISIEVCGSLQNLGDKRSRYAGLGSSIVLRCRKGWLLQEITMQKGARRPRWRVLGLRSKPEGHAQIPIRFLRVLYALPNAEYSRLRDALVPAGHEYYCPHSSLASHGSPSMIKFLTSLSIHSHFYTT